MGFLSDALGKLSGLDFIGDTFFGGDEKDAAKEARKGAERAANAYDDAVQRAIDFQRDAQSQALALQDPYLQGGGYANQAALRAMGLPTYDLQDRTFSPRVEGFAPPPGVNPAQGAGGLPSLDTVPRNVQDRYRQMIDKRIDLSGDNVRERSSFQQELEQMRAQYPGLSEIDTEYVNRGLMARQIKPFQPSLSGGVLGGQQFGSAANPVRTGDIGTGVGGGMMFAGGSPTFDESAGGQMFDMQGNEVRPSYTVANTPGGVLGKLDSVQDPDQYGGFTTSPGYQFARDQGLQAIERAAATSGLLGSGRYLKDSARFATGLANQEFGNYFNRLQALSGGGQAAAAGSGVLGTGANLGQSALSGGQVRADSLMTAGQARASGILGANQARGNSIAQLAQIAGGFL